MRMKGIAGIVLMLFLVNALTMTFVAVSGQTTSSASIKPFPQTGKFYTTVTRGFTWHIMEGKKITCPFEDMLKCSVQNVVHGIATVNLTLFEVGIPTESGGEASADIYDVDYEIATDRTIQSGYIKIAHFGSVAGFKGSESMSLDCDISEHTWAWSPTDLRIGTEVPVGWVAWGGWENRFPDDTIYVVAGEEVIQVLGEKQDCWKLHMKPSTTVDGRVFSDTFWVDKDTGVPLKELEKCWKLDGTGGWEGESVLTRTNIDLGPESTKAPAPTYTLTVPTSPGFPEAGKFYTWYHIADHYNNKTGVTSYEEGFLLRWIVSATDDKALLCRIDLVESICEAEGVGELEAVTLNCINYTIGTTSRGYLNAIGSQYHVNMTSLSWWTKGFNTEWRIGRETSYWVPTSLYKGANVDIEVGTWTVVDEKIVNALGEWQTTWVAYSPPTYEELWNVWITDTEYIDKDVGISLEFISKEEYTNEIDVYRGWLIDTNIDLGPEVKPSVKLTGELDYLSGENVKIRLTALVTDANTMNPISGPDVTIKIYRPDGSPWLSARMVERLPRTGIYEWQTSGTIYALGLKKGVYLVHAQASFPGEPTSSDILEFHIDPPADSSASSALTTLIATVLLGFAGLILLTKFALNQLRRTSQKSNVHIQ